MDDFGQWLKAELKKRKMSLINLEIESGVSANSLVKYTNGRTNPGLKNVLAILDALGIEVILREKAG